MVKRHIHHKILLDENLPPREKLPKTNHRHDVKHIKHDYKYGGYGDEFVYTFAKRLERTIVTINWKDYRGFNLTKKIGLIGVSGNMKTKDIDNKLCSFLTNTTLKQLYGSFHRISNRSKTKRG